MKQAYETGPESLPTWEEGAGVNCSICGKPVVLRPSAAERAAKSNMPAAHYTALFTRHAECEIAERNERNRPRKRIKNMHPAFQQLGLLHLRQQAAKLYGIHAGSQRVADRVNGMDEDQLIAELEHEKANRNDLQLR